MSSALSPAAIMPGESENMYKKRDIKKTANAINQK
jgi:hypothetical protein